MDDSVCGGLKIIRNGHLSTRQPLTNVGHSAPATRRRRKCSPVFPIGVIWLSSVVNGRRFTVGCGCFVIFNLQKQPLGGAKTRRVFQGLQNLALGLGFRIAARVQQSRQLKMHFHRIRRIEQQQLAIRVIACSFAPVAAPASANAR